MSALMGEAVSDYGVGVKSLVLWWSPGGPMGAVSVFAKIIYSKRFPDFHKN